LRARGARLTAFGELGAGGFRELTERGIVCAISEAFSGESKRSFEITRFVG
jgi:hypothetical protein